MPALAVLSNVTVGPFFARELRQIVDEPLILPAGYNTWVQDLLQPSANLLASKAVFLLLDGCELLGGRGVDFPQNPEAALQPFMDVIAGFKKRFPQVLLMVSTLDIPQRTLLPGASPRNELGLMAWWRAKISALELPVIELAEIAARMGRTQFYSEKMWYYGSLPYSMQGEKSLAHACARCFRGVLGIKRKCLVLDLDHTLWGGVVGENGTEGLVLAEHGEGAIYRDFQKRIQELHRQGILLAIVSKNQAEDAAAGLAHPQMVLRAEDFVAIKANWRSKPDNLRQLAQDLNIGLDSFVFIDDNPVEREAVRSELPDVAVPEFPSHPAELPEFIAQVAALWFSTYSVTREDGERTEQYSAQLQRMQEERPRFATLEEYLASLKMRLTISEAGEADVARAAQLSQKTNQFNLTLRRYSEVDIRSMLMDPQWKLWVGRLEDRFGGYGTVLLCLVHLAEGVARVDLMLMSCRVMGREVERAFVQNVQERCSALGVLRMEAEYVPGPRNAVVKNFWQELGFAPLQDEGALRFIKDAPFSPCAAEKALITIDHP